MVVIDSWSLYTSGRWLRFNCNLYNLFSNFKDSHPPEAVGDLLGNNSFKKSGKSTSKLDNPPSYQQATQKVEEADLVSGKICGPVVEYSAHDRKVVGLSPIKC